MMIHPWSVLAYARRDSPQAKRLEFARFLVDHHRISDWPDGEPPKHDPRPVRLVQPRWRWRAW